MRTKKLMPLLIIPLLFGLCTNSALAWFNTPVQTSTLYMLGEPVAKMGTTTEYGYDAPASDTFPHFYSALIVSGSVGLGCLWFPEEVKIEVNGTDPNGNPLSGDRFGDRDVLLSPDDSNVEQIILKTIYDVLVSCLPTGLEEFVKNTMSAGGATHDKDETMAWGKWKREPLGTCKKERGLRFRYALVVDPNLKGTYTINIHYHTWICSLGADNIVRHAGYIDLYDTVEYTYGIYDLSVETYLTNGTTIFDVPVFIDDERVGETPWTGEVELGNHTIAVADLMFRNHYKYTFKYWEDGSTSDPRTVNVIQDMTLRAYYDVTYHDVAVIDMTASPTRPAVGELTSINVTVENQGNFTETFDVSAYYTLTVDPLIGTQPVTDLLPSESRTLIFEWTPNMTGRYEIRAEAPLPKDIDPADNTATTIVATATACAQSAENHNSVNGFHIVGLAFAMFGSIIVLAFRKNGRMSLCKMPASILKQNLRNNLPNNTNMWHDYTRRKLT